MKRVSTPPSSPRRDDKQSFCTPERTHEYSLKSDRAKSPRNMLDCITFGENNPNNVDATSNNDALSMLANAAAAVKVETPKAHVFVVYRKKTNEFLSINPRKISKVKTNNNSGGSIRRTILLDDGRVVKLHHFSCNRMNFRTKCDSCLKANKSKCTKGDQMYILSEMMKNTTDVE